jgi:hypothetical protein
MQSSVPELIASLCPDHAEVEIYNEKEAGIPRGAMRVDLQRAER